ncbi:nicotinate-nucleotide adenylyltransferase [Aurantivibrio plasticivorans]
MCAEALLLSGGVRVKRVAMFGGTFDPVHRGHIQMATELKAYFRLDEMRLVPCHIPPHRPQPIANVNQRLEMLSLAVEDHPDLTIDTVELDSPDTSYSLNTLKVLREELGNDVSLSIGMGMDSLASLASWHRWRELLNFGHIVVAARPGYQLPESGELIDFIEAHRGEAIDVQQQAKGKVVLAELSLVNISSTVVREALLQNENVSSLLPQKVSEYLHTNAIYTPNSLQKTQKVSFNG